MPRAAGRTNSPLCIGVNAEFSGHPEITKLRDQGHRIVEVALTGYDLVLDARAWRWSDEMWPLLPVAIKAARARRKEAR